MCRSLQRMQHNSNRRRKRPGPFYASLSRPGGHLPATEYPRRPTTASRPSKSGLPLPRHVVDEHEKVPELHSRS